MCDSADHNAKEVKYRSYPSRWYILIVYATFACLQALIFNTWGQIAQSAKIAFCWTDATVAWTSNVMLIVGMAAAPCSYYVLHMAGLRNTVVWAGAGVLALGSSLRCVSMSGPVLEVTSLVCGALNGWASIMIEATLTMLSVTWFPVSERTTATGIVIAVQMSGLIPPALLFPRIVQEPPANVTSCEDESVSSLRAEISHDVANILYTEAGLCVAVFLVMLLYFPAGPPSPPSQSAQAERYKFREGIRNIVTSYPKLIIGVAFASINVPMMWITVANQNLHPLGMSQKDTGYINSIIIVSAVALNLLNSRLSDKFAGRLKSTIVVFLSLSLVFSIWLALLCFEVIPSSKVTIYTSAIGCMLSLRCIIALFYELLMEVHYPVSESLATLTWGQVGRLLAALFLGMFSLEGAGVIRGVTWMNYCLVIFIALPLACLLVVKVEYGRSNRDQEEESGTGKMENSNLKF